jgi:phage shock protein PspC (stress-responsive transcriptional regulator)
MDEQYNKEWRFRDLKKSKKDCKIAGVCGGFGENTPIPSWLWRVIFLSSILMGGFGLITYLILWVSMPSAESSVS